MSGGKIVALASTVVLAAGCTHPVPESPRPHTAESSTRTPTTDGGIGPSNGSQQPVIRLFEGPLPAEGLVVGRGGDITFLTTDGGTIGSLGDVSLYYDRTVPGPVVVRRGSTFYVLRVHAGTFQPLADRDEAFALSPQFQPHVALPRPAGSVPEAGRWGFALPGPGGAILAQWSGECEVPTAMLATGRTLAAITGESARIGPDVASSVALGWDDAGRALAYVRGGACGTPFDQPGITPSMKSELAN